MRLFDFIFAARPLLHLPVWSIYLVSLHYHQQLSGDPFAWQDIGILSGLTLLAAGAYYLNQVYDIDTDARNAKLGFVGEGILTPKALVGAFLFTSAAGLGLGLVFSFVTVVIFAQLFLLGYFYSVPPTRLKDRAVWGLLANAWSFGLLVPLSIMPGLSLHNAGLLGWDNPLYFFLAVASIYLLTTIPDRVGDRLVGKKTLAVIWPPAAVKGLALVLMAGAAVIAAISGFALLVYVALFSLFPILASLLMPTPPVERMAAKLPILLLTVLAGMFYTPYLVFVVVLVAATRLYYARRFKIVYPRLF